MKSARIFAASVTLCLAACASSSTTQPQQDPGVGGPGVGAGQAPDTNPQGVAYPTDHIGTNARSSNHPGDRIANYKFLGYPGGDVSKGLQPISLANYFDPTGQTYKVIHIQASGSWCPHCANEIKAATPLANQLASMKAVWLVSLAEGPTPGTPSTDHDLQQWIAIYGAPFTQWLDPGNKNLGPFYDAAALPWNADISAKTMEILTSGTGAVETSQGIVDELNSALAAAAATGSNVLQ